MTFCPGWLYEPGLKTCHEYKSRAVPLPPHFPSRRTEKAARRGRCCQKILWPPPRWTPAPTPPSPSPPSSAPLASTSAPLASRPCRHRPRATAAGGEEEGAAAMGEDRSSERHAAVDPLGKIISPECAAAVDPN